MDRLSISGILIAFMMIFTSMATMATHEVVISLNDGPKAMFATNNSQNDGGSGADAGNNSNNSVTLSSNNSTEIGWVDDTTDAEDLYKVWIPSGEILTVVMNFPSTEDFDLYLTDSAKTFSYDLSEYSNPEVVSTSGTNISNGTTYVYIYVVAWSGFGQYSLNLTFTNPVAQNDAGSGGDAGDMQSNALTLSSSSATYGGWFDWATDSVDLYNITIPAGNELWVNLSYPSGGNFSLVMIDGGWTFYVDQDNNITTGSASITTNGTNQSSGGVMVYFGMIANSGGGNYTMEIDIVNPNASQTPAVSTTMTSRESATNHFTGLTTGVNYSIDYEVYSYPIAQNGTNATSSFYWLANSSSLWHNVTMDFPEIEGTYILYSYLSLNGSTLAYDFDYVEHEMLEGSLINATSTSLSVSNISSGYSYSVQWSWADNVTNTTVDSGWYNFTASSTTKAISIVMNAPSTVSEHLLSAILWNGSTISGYEELSYTPVRPTVEVTGVTNNANASTNTVSAMMSNLTSGTTYSYDFELNHMLNGTYVASSNMANFTATNSSFTPTSWIYNTPSSSGFYCGVANIYLGTTLVDTDSYCFVLTHDNDGDGVSNENDLCPATAAGANVDSDGCSTSQRDSDGDGWFDDVDAFVNDSTQWADSDGDGYGDNANGSSPDAFPQDSTQWSDIDGDGYGDNQSGVDADLFPFDSSQWKDTDGDGYGDNSNGTAGDMYPLDSSQWYDSDGDGYGDNGWGNNPDAFPGDSTQWSDQDGDGYGDNASGNNPDIFPTDDTQWADQDGDGWGDNQQGDDPDRFPSDSTQWADSDGDGYGDNQQGTNPDAFPNDGTQWADRDGDGYGDNLDGNEADIFPDDPTQWADSDGDGYGDEANGNSADLCPGTPSGQVVDENGCSDSQHDSDSDLVMDDDDLCPNTSLGQTVNSQGCAQNQLDEDMDGVNNSWDSCPNTTPGTIADNAGCSPEQLDTDGDGIDDLRDICPTTTAGESVDGVGCAEYEKDDDEDGVHDGIDQCPGTQSDESVDLEGCSASQRDSDGDGVMDSEDQCSLTDPGTSVNAEGCGGYQVDSDEDGVNDEIDQCPGTIAGTFVSTVGCSLSQIDIDGDGIDDAADLCPGTIDGAEVDLNGCSPDQRDSDEDGVTDIADICPHTIAESFVDANGCALDQKDSDNDGIPDANDAFPNDPDETKDTDNDGVADGEDYFPNDATMSRADQAESQSWILYVLLFVVGSIAVGLFFTRSSSSKTSKDDSVISDELFQQALPAEYLQEMADISSPEQDQWVDDDGVNWYRQPDGSVMYFDTISNEWKAN
jgi:hypothetical protein